MSNAPDHLKLSPVSMKVIVGTRYAEVSSEDGIRWGHVLRTEIHPYNTFIVVHFDDTPFDEEALVLEQSIVRDFDFEQVLNAARLQYERRYFDYRQAIQEQYEVSSKNRGYKNENDAKEALTYGTDLN